MKSPSSLIALALVVVFTGCGREEKEEIVSSSDFLAVGDSTYVFRADEEFFEKENPWNPKENLPLSHREYWKLASDTANSILDEDTEWHFTGISISEGYKQPWKVIVSLSDASSADRFAVIPMSINGSPLPHQESDLPVETLLRRDQPVDADNPYNPPENTKNQLDD